MANIMMYLKTNNYNYITKAESYSDKWRKNEARPPTWRDDWVWDWDDMQNPDKLLLYRITRNASYKDNLELGLSKIADPGGFVAKYSPGGQMFLLEWGSLRYSADAANLHALWAKDPLCTPSKVANYTQFAENQINYILGNNPLDRSYVVGFGKDYGKNYPIHVHHRGSHGTWMNSLSQLPAENQHILYGALAGGPGAPDDQHNDVRSDYQENEVAMDYNFGLIGALSYLAGKYPSNGSPIAGFPRAQDFRPESERETEYLCQGKIVDENPNILTMDIEIHNHAAWPATVLDQMSYRYYFDIREFDSTPFTIDDISVSITYSEVPTTLIGPTLVSGSQYYIEVDFSSTDIFPGGKPYYKRLTTVHISKPWIWNSYNDWSYNFTISSPDMETVEKIPVYNDGVLIGGLEPGTSATPISLPFWFTGIGENYWVTDALPSFINSWCIELLEINGVSFTNQYILSHQLPAPIGGKYYIHYISPVPYGHFEAGDAVPSNPVSTPITTPFYWGNAGDFYWETDSIPNHINSWNMIKLEINGVDLTNQYKNSWELPPKIGGKYYIHYVGTVYGHFEAV